MTKARQWLRVGTMLTTIILSSLGMMTTVSACEWLYEKHLDMIESEAEISGAYPTELALTIIKEHGYLNERVFKESSETWYRESYDENQPYDSIEATVTITQEFFTPKDVFPPSLKGHEFTVHFVRNDLGDWLLYDLEKASISFSYGSEKNSCSDLPISQ